MYARKASEVWNFFDISNLGRKARASARLWRRYWWPAPLPVTQHQPAAAAAAATWVFLNGTNPIHT